jgi:hypothetical protein
LGECHQDSGRFDEGGSQTGGRLSGRCFSTKQGQTHLPGFGLQRTWVIEFVANEPGDWAIHCHKTHHTMNAMGHSVRTFIGTNSKSVTKTVRRLVPDYMPMGSSGMADMGSMEMPMPENTLPMVTGFGQFGPMETGGKGGMGYTPQTLRHGY